MKEFSREEAMAEIARRQASKPSQGESALRGGFDTLTLGFAPKASAAIGAGLVKLADPSSSFAQNYEKGRDYLREQNRAAAEENPLSYFGGGLVGGVLNPIARGANTIAGAAKSGARVGGLYGAGSSDKGEVGSFGGENVVDTLIGAGLGGAFGAGGQTLINKVIAPKLSNLVMSKINPKNAIDARASEVPIGNTPLQPINPNVNPLSQKALALSQQFKVPLTRGQASQDLSQQTLEDLLASGARGSEAANIMNSARQQGNEAFQNAALSTRKQIGSGEFVEKGQSLQGIVDKIVGNFKSEEKAVNKAYDIAKQTVGYLNIKDLKGFNKVANAKFVEEALTPDNAPAAYSQLRSFNKIFSTAPKKAKEIDFKRIEAYRQGLNRSYKSAQGQDKHGIGLLKDQFDDYLNDTLETALVRGDANVLEQFKNARGLASDLKTKYYARDKGEFGKKFIQDLVENSKKSRESYTYGMISDKLWGANKYGFKQQAISAIKEIKNHVGEDNPLLDGLKLDGVQKVIKPLLNQKGEVNFNGPSIQTYKNNLKENESVLRSLLSKEELKQLYDLGDLGSFMFQSRKSIGNPSQSGIVRTLAELPIIQKALGLPLVKEIPDAYNAFQAKSAINQATLEKGVAALNKQSLPPAPTLPIRDTKAASSLGASANALIDALSREPQAQQTEQQQPVVPQFTKEDALKEIERRKSNKAMSGIQTSPQELSQKQSEGQTQYNPTNELIDKIAYIESGGNPNAKAKGSTASGLFQFTNPTWKDAVSRYGEQTGIGLKDKNNPKAQRIMAQLMLKDNAKDLGGFLNREPRPTEIYLTHFLGLNGAKNLLASHPQQFAARVLPEAAKANRSVFFKNGRPLTVAELYNILSKKVEKV